MQIFSRSAHNLFTVSSTISSSREVISTSEKSIIDTNIEGTRPTLIMSFGKKDCKMEDETRDLKK